jgi:hypothetical protein
VDEQPKSNSKSGLRCITLYIASLTQSTGVPLHAKAACTGKSYESGWSRKRLLIVTACPIPDCGLSGATTTISPKGSTASVRASIPFEYTPSSLVTSISGRAFSDFIAQTYSACA